jgi:senataxin
MLSGPPGSGKTQILVAILHLLYQFDFTVLVCIPQKTGTFQLWKILEASGYPINDIIVLDSLKGFRLPKRFHQTCLCIKSHEFYTCLVMVKQWIEEMQMLLRLQMYCPSSCKHVPKDGRCTRTSLPLFTSKLFRKAFLPLSIDMRKCLIELSDKFTKMCLPNKNKSDIDTILNLLEAFKNLLFNETPSEDHIQRAFGFLPPLPIAENLIQLTSGSYGHLVARQVNDERLKFADLLQNFGKLLSVPKFENIKEVECYCIAHSKVVIGTPQSLFQLHAMKTKSIDVLVVDDACQLKESDLIVPLCLSLKHVQLFGDFCTSPPMVKSKVREKSFFCYLIFSLLSNR